MRSKGGSLPFSAGQTILSEGDPGKEMFVIEEGQVELFRRVAGAIEVTRPHARPSSAGPTSSAERILAATVSAACRADGLGTKADATRAAPSDPIHTF